MTGSTDTGDNGVVNLRVPRSTDNGLWSALASRLSDRSAAGSRLAGPTGLGQPISTVVIDMFAFREARDARLASPLPAA